MSKNIRNTTENNKNSNDAIQSNEIVDSLDKNIFFSVSEAKKRTNLIYKKKLEVDMLPIYNAINEEINKGNYHVELKLTDAQKSFLINKNFGVVYLKTDGYKNSYFKVYWN